MPKYTQAAPEKRTSLLKPGNYKVTVEKCEQEVSSKNNDMFTLVLSVNGTNNKVFDRLVFVEAAYFKINQARAAMDFDIDAGKEIEINADDFIGKEAWVSIGEKEYQGNKTNEVRFWIHDEDEIAQLEDDKNELEATPADKAHLVAGDASGI